MPRLQSNISNGDQGKRGPEVANVGSDVNPQSGGELSLRKGNSQPGAAMRKPFDRGLGAPVILDVQPAVGAANKPLTGHNEIDFSAVHGPARPWAKAEQPGGGEKTPDAPRMLRKGRD